MHSLLLRQIRRHLSPDGTYPAELGAFINAIDAAYTAADQDRALSERSLETAAQDAMAHNELLRRINAEFKAVRNAAMDAIVIMDHAGRIVEFNAAAQRMFGWPGDKAVGQPLADLLLPQRLRDAHWRELHRYLADGRNDTVGRRTQTTGIRADGTEFPIEQAVTAHQAIAGSMSLLDEEVGPRFTYWMQDITDRLRAEAEREMSRKMTAERDRLRESVAALGHVLGVVGHELRTPISGLRTMTELLLNIPAEQLPQHRQDFIPLMHTELLRMSSMVNNVLEAARLNMGIMRWNWDIVELRRVVREAVETSRMAAAQVSAAGAGSVAEVPSIEITDDPQSLPIHVLGDADALRRLVVNLVNNARQHAQRGPVRVSASLGEESGWVVITVQDAGCGIPPERLARLGQPFALNSGVVGTQWSGGTGLGLAICKGIAAAHGGRIEVESEVDRGTLVRVLLRSDVPAPITESAGDGIVASRSAATKPNDEQVPAQQAAVRAA